MLHVVTFWGTEFAQRFQNYIHNLLPHSQTAHDQYWP